MSDSIRPYGALNLFQPPTSERALFQQALTRVLAKIEDMVPRHGLRNPRISSPGAQTYHYCDADEWVASFWPGQLWLAHSLTGASALKETARMRRRYFRTVLETPDWHDHDLGFQFSLTAVADHTLTGSKQAKSMGLRAADALAARWRQPMRCLTCWNPSPRDSADLAYRKPGVVIVDSIQNMALLFWASRVSGQPSYGRIARMHLQTCLDHLVRPDGSAFHAFEFDPRTGDPIRGFTHQGHADDSTWSRGQGWCIHGFAQAYLHTGEAIWRDAATRMADHIADKLPEDGVPLWDFRLRGDAPQVRDSSAGAIIAAGLYALATCYGDDGPQVHRFTDMGDRMLAALVQECDISGDREAEGLLKDGAAHVELGLVDVMLPYGDYYYVEALMRALGHTEFFW